GVLRGWRWGEGGGGEGDVRARGARRPGAQLHLLGLVRPHGRGRRRLGPAGERRAGRRIRSPGAGPGAPPRAPGGPRRRRGPGPDAAPGLAWTGPARASRPPLPTP